MPYSKKQEQEVQAMKGIKTEKELEEEIDARWGNFELSHDKNTLIVKAILEYVLRERKEYAREAIKADRENVANDATVEKVEVIIGEVNYYVVNKDSIINAPQIELL